MRSPEQLVEALRQCGKLRDVYVDGARLEAGFDGFAVHTTSLMFHGTCFRRRI